MRLCRHPQIRSGRLLSDKEIEAKQALVGELSTYDCLGAGGKVRHMASLHTSVGQLLKPILEPR